MIISAVFLVLGLLSPSNWLMELLLLSSVVSFLVFLWFPDLAVWEVTERRSVVAVFLGLSLFSLLIFSSNIIMVFVLFLVVVVSWFNLFYFLGNLEGLVLVSLIILGSSLIRFRGDFNHLDVLGLLIMTLVFFRTVKVILKNEK